MTKHLRRIDVERLSTGEVVDGAEHLDSCTECRAAVEALRLEAAAFVRAHPSRALVARINQARPAPLWRRWWPLVVPLAAAAAVASFVVVRQPTEVRLKGASISVLVNGASLLSSDSVVNAGDRLSFVVEAARPMHALVLDFEVGKPVSVFVPFEGAASLAVPAGRTVVPDGVVLDDAPVREWLVTLWCDRPVSVEQLALPVSWPDAPPQLSVEGCQVERVELRRPGR